MRGQDRRPAAVTIAGLCLCVLLLWQVGVKLLPALAAGDSSAADEGLSAALSLLIIWGVFSRQRWAWWLAVIGCGITAAGMAAALVFIEEIQRAANLADAAGLRGSITFLAATAGIAFLCLMSESGRSAFR